MVAKHVIHVMLSIVCVLSVDVPVLIWTNHKWGEEVGPQMEKETVNPHEFENIVSSLLCNKPILLVFVEPVLEPHKVFEDKHCFSKAKSLGQTKLRFHNIHHPLRSLYQRPDIYWRYIKLLPKVRSFTVPDLHNASLFLVFDEATQDNIYYRHDDIITTTYNAVIKKYDNVVAVLSAFSSQWRAKPGLEDTMIRSGMSNKPVLLRNKHIMLYSRTSPVLHITTPTYSESLSLRNSSLEIGGKNQLIVLAPANSLNIYYITFVYSELDDYIWKMDKILLTPRRAKVSGSNKSMGLRSMVIMREAGDAASIESYQGASYHCHNIIVFSTVQRNIKIVFTFYT
ncbi:hypothetical protein L9F63_021412, partial [Diploptera punctata]